ncbi:MAG: hypothetical protein U0Z44_03525 [Kouleothrix sp.]
MAQAIGESIPVQLRRLNSELANYVPAEYQPPRVMLRPTGDPEYFPENRKHRYTRASLMLHRRRAVASYER